MSFQNKPIFFNINNVKNRVHDSAHLSILRGTQLAEVACYRGEGATDLRLNPSKKASLAAEDPRLDGDGDGK